MSAAAPVIGAIGPEHLPQILRLNTRFVHWLSPLDMDGLEALIAEADLAVQIAGAAGVLIGFDSASDIDRRKGHKNITWLRQHFDDFVYIDRVMIDPICSGQGLGRKLYDHAADFARQNSRRRLVCEVNTKPDNPGSHAFHLALGFRAIGDVDYVDFDAAVRYYEKTV